MAVANTKSIQISNLDAVPVQHNNPFTGRGDIIEAVATVEAAASDNNGSVYRLFRISSGARVGSLQIMNDANTSGTSYKAGVLLTAADGGGTVVASSDTIFFSGVTMASARNAFTELLLPAVAGNSGDQANAEKRIWELLGLSADPFKQYDVCITATTAGSAGGTISAKIQYVE